MIYPEIEVTLIGENGNVFNLMGIVTKAMRKHKVPQDKIDEFTEECFACKTYEQALLTFIKWVNVS